MKPSAAIEIDHVWKFYGDYPALRDYTLNIGQGSCCALLGRNGAGKTTILRILAGLSSHQRGTVRILGASPRSSEVRRSVGFLGHGIGVYEDLSAHENLLFFARVVGLENVMRDPVHLDTDALDRVAGLTKERGELKVVITGYTDDRGKKAANERESLGRAETVRDYLVSRKHLDAGRTEVKGAGPADPAASNDSEEGRLQNRRVVLRIMTEDGKYQPRAALGVQVHPPLTSGPAAQ